LSYGKFVDRYSESCEELAVVDVEVSAALLLELYKEEKALVIGDVHERTGLEDFPSFKDWKEQYMREKAAVKRQSMSSDRASQMVTDYGVSPYIWDSMLKAQGSCCKCCGVDSSEVERGLEVDHNHENGNVRGLVCGKCNKLIARYKDDAGALHADGYHYAAEYVEDDGEWMDFIWEEWEAIVHGNTHHHPEREFVRSVRKARTRKGGGFKS